MRRVLGTCATLAMLAWAGAAEAACDLPVRDGPIISIGGDVTEIVYALGAGARVVAVDITSRHPKEARDLPQVGYMRQLSAEPILSLWPALILAIADSGPPQVLDQLQSAGTCLALVPDEHSPAGVLKSIDIARTISALLCVYSAPLLPAAVENGQPPVGFSFARKCVAAALIAASVLAPPPTEARPIAA